MRHPYTTCSVVDCDLRAKVWTSGLPLCGTHHRRWARHGDPTIIGKTKFYPQEIIQKMELDIESKSREGCWEWDWSLNEGYGKVGRKKATHISLELDGRPRPEAPANLALHSCDNKWCWNPGHLRWGTDQENRQDYVDRWGYCPHCDHCNQERGEA